MSSKYEFQILHRLPVNDEINQCVLLDTLKFVSKLSPNYLNKVFHRTTELDET